MLLTEKEREAILILFKSIDEYYNSNSLSKILNISHVGTYKILKRFKNERITITKKIGKSIVHKLNFDEEYTKKLISFLLVDEANNFKRWKDEFKEIENKNRIILIYGSIIKNYKIANDIDIMVILEKSDIKNINKFITEKNKILPKKIHCIKLTEQDIIKNIKEKQKAIIDIIKNAVVLSGTEKYVEVLKNVTSF